VSVDASRLAAAAVLYALAAAGLVVGWRARRRWKEAVLLAASLAVATGFAEVVLRLVRPYESMARFRWIASARLHHENPPARRMFSGYVGATPVVVLTNEDGLRTPYTRESFARNGVRIAVLGDSFVFGAGVNEPDAFPARLEADLRRRLGRSDIGVLNAGVISYSPLLESLQLEAVVAAYRPTLVLLLFDATDVGDDVIYAGKARRRDGGWEFPLEGETHLGYHGAVYERLRGPFAWIGARLLYPIELAQAAAGQAPPVKASYYLEPVIFEGRPENRFFIYRYPLERTATYFEATFRHIEATASAADGGGGRFALVVAPRYHHWNPRECPYDWQRGAYGVDEPFQHEYFRFFDQKRAAAAFPIVDLLPAFQKTTEAPLVFPHDPHWNPQGHAFVARTLADALIGNGLIARR
jgi:hypothetical protein